MNGLTKAVIYCRVSSDKQVRHGHGLDGQEARCAVYARERNLDVVKVFRDEAISGRVENRPAFNELIDFIEASEDGYVVIIDDLNRLARDVVVSRALKLLIKGSGSTLACVNFEFEDSPENEYFETIVVATGEYERRKNRQRVMSRQHARLEAGYWVFAPPKGYRYEKVSGHGKLLVPDEPNASLISEVIGKFASGELMTLSDTRDFLEERGLQNRSGKPMSPTVEETKRILSRLIYTGYVEYKPWKVAEVVGHHEALVGRKTFDAVRHRMSGRARAPTRCDLAKDFPLRSSVLCGDCGSSLTGSWSTGRTKRYPYYRCPNTKSCSAQRKSIPKQRLEADFLQFLQSVCPRPGVVKLARRVTDEVWREQSAKSAEQQDRASKAAQDTEAQIERLIDQLVKSDSPAVRARLENRIEKLEKDAEQERRRANRPALSEEQFGTALNWMFAVLERPQDFWQAGNLEQRRIIQSLLFTGPIEYSASNGFGTTKFSLPFKLLQLDRQEKPELVEVVRTNWNHLISDVSEWSGVLENAFPASKHHVTH